MTEGIPGLLRIFLGEIRPAKYLILRPGQVLSGRVLEVAEGRAAILLNGLNVVAELETGLAAGERVLLRVEEQRPDGRVLLKKIAAEGSGGKVEEGEVEALLHYFGLKTGKLNAALVEQMLRAGMPISGSVVRYLSSFLAENNFSPEHIPALLWLWNRGLPVTREAVNAVHSLMQEGHWGSKIKDFIRGLYGSTVTESGGSSLNSLLRAFDSVLFKAGEDGGQLAGKLQNLVKNLGLEHERGIFELAASDKAGIAHQETTGFKPESGQEPSLKSALLQLMQSSEAGGMSSHRKAVSELLREVTGLQLLNISGWQEADGPSLFLQGWIGLYEGEIVPFFLKIKRYSRRKGAEEDVPCQVLFFITTKHLGEVMCRLAVERGYLTCGFTADGEEHRKLIDRYLAVLESKLEGLPWKVIIYPTKAGSGDEMQKIRQREVFESGFRVTNTLDTRV